MVIQYGVRLDVMTLVTTYDDFVVPGKGHIVKDVADTSSGAVAGNYAYEDAGRVWDGVCAVVATQYAFVVVKITVLWFKYGNDYM